MQELRRAPFVRLWFSYQRYGLLLVGGPVGLAALAAVTTPWWVAATLIALAAVPFRFGVVVLARWRRKLRATRVAEVRIHQGRFAPASVRNLCGDPCFRVVAREILARSGMPRAERNALVVRFAAELRGEDCFLVLVDHIGGAVFTVAGDGEIRRDRICVSSDLHLEQRT